MATTRIIPMHINKSQTIAQMLTDSTGYGLNPEKTGQGAFVTAYACDRHTADAEFLLAQREYAQLTGRTQDGGVILYQIRQSFKPGEITPEEANRVGYELASRFLKGKHAFSSARTPTKSIFTITSTGTPSRWIISINFGIFSVRGVPSRGSAT